MPAPTNALAPQPSNALMDAYRQNTDMRARTYGESLLKSFTGNVNKPITNTDFTQEQLATLNNFINSHYQKRMELYSRPKSDLLRDATQVEKEALDKISFAERNFDPKKETTKEAYANTIKRAQSLQTKARQLREAASGKLPTDFAFAYEDYRPPGVTEHFYQDPQGWNETLGRFRYKVDPTTGTYEVYDKYDFNNEALRSGKNYTSMSAPERLLTSLASTAAGNKFALGEAYLSGENSIPVNIKGKLK